MGLRTVSSAATLALALVIAASERVPARGVQLDPASSTCAYNFGSGDFIWCVSQNGHILRLQSPSSPQVFEHLQKSFGPVCEGYGLAVGTVVNPLVVGRQSSVL